MDMQSVIAALRDRYSKMASLDTPKDHDLVDMAQDIGYGFVPGIGTALAGRDYERARRDSDYLGMGLSTLGMIPVAGGVTRAINTLRKAKGAAKVAEEAPALRETLEAALAKQAETEKALSGFGKKAEREVDRQREIQKGLSDAQQLASNSPGVDIATQLKKAGGQREGGAVAPDFYRRMEVDQGPQAVLAEARAGGHITRRADGTIIGAPRHIENGAGLGAMRRGLDRQFDEGAEALRVADPERVGNWYERAKAGQAESNQPYQLDRSLNAHSVYSAGVAPDTELAFALKHHNTRALGAPEIAYRGAGARKLDDAVEASVQPTLGFKIGEYGVKNDPRVPVSGSFGVNDFRAAQGFGYTDAQGNPWKAGVSSAMHPFMDAETALMVNRANERSAGGRTNWTGPQLQEVPWVWGKANDLYGRGKNARFSDGIQGKIDALREANKTSADFFPKHSFGSTYEYVPGANTGHVPEMLTASDDAKRAYGASGRWDTELNDAALYSMPDAVGAGNRDAIHYAMGLRQLPSQQGVGVYKNTAGQVENNPNTVGQLPDRR